MKRNYIVTAVLVGFIFLGACTKEHKDLPAGFRYEPPPTPEDLEVDGSAETATLTWNYPEESRGPVQFRVYTELEFYGLLYIDTTEDTFYIHSQLIGNNWYCYKVSAVDTVIGLEGWRTDTVCEFVPSASD
ncbi:MAG: hypothetical protein JSV33_07185 [bacterium]|nr:MAG: hypothetical protein JSV33_07185 [bacterium]